MPRPKVKHPVQKPSPDALEDLMQAGGKRIIVHLGNVGEGNETEAPADKTRRYAKFFPGFQFVGIDLKELPEKDGVNWIQIKADFLEGLEKLKDGSVSIISSEMALGWSGEDGKGVYLNKRNQYNLEVLKLARRKLASGGKIMMVVGRGMVNGTVEKLRESEFEAVETRPLTEVECRRTYWTKTMAGSKLYQITAVK